MNLMIVSDFDVESFLSLDDARIDIDFFSKRWRINSWTLSEPFIYPYRLPPCGKIAVMGGRHVMDQRVYHTP